MARRRTWQQLDARDRAWAERATGTLTLPDADLSTWLRTHQARLEGPTPTRPYWSVWQRGRFLAAARAPRDAIARAIGALDVPLARGA